MKERRTLRLIGDWLPVIRARAFEKSLALVSLFELRMDRIMAGWIAVFFLAALPRLTFPLTPVRSLSDFAEIFLPYAMIMLAPIAGYGLAARSFPRETRPRQITFRLAVYGRWRKLDAQSARSHPDFGPAGFMASLLAGLLLNVPVRTFEFLISVPAMNARAPEWGQALFHVMTFDVVAMNFIYMVCFVMALRSFPLFPRMLLLAWGMDAMFQLAIANYVSAVHGLPATVAVSLRQVLSANLEKLTISVVIWLPYLLLSQRVNVTYRQRVPIA